MSRTVLAVLISLALAPVVASSAGPPANSTESTRAAVQTFVKSYVEAVNKGDVTTVMEMFSRKPGVTSIGDAEISRGWDAIRSDNDKMVGKEGSYKFSIGAIDVMPLGASYALALAPYTVTAETDKGTIQAEGAMTMVLEKSAGKWLIVHEHESTKAQEEAEQGGE